VAHFSVIIPGEARSP